MKKKNLFYLASAVVFVALLLPQTSIFNTKAGCANGALPECVDEGKACIINGTPCCGSYTCKGKFPNTTCQ